MSISRSFPRVYALWNPKHRARNQSKSQYEVSMKTQDTTHTPLGEGLSVTHIRLCDPFENWNFLL